MSWASLAGVCLTLIGFSKMVVTGSTYSSSFTSALVGAFASVAGNIKNTIKDDSFILSVHH
jgi:hypothetical protein